MAEVFQPWQRRLSLLARPRHPEALPAILDRKRIYVLPTRFGLFYGVLVFTMALGALNYNNNPALLLALLLAATGLASLISAHLQLSGLRIEAISADPVAAGKPLHLQLALSHRDQRPRRGLQLICLDARGSANIDAQEPAVAALVVPTHHRGWLDLDRIRIATTQPLGLALAWAWIWPDLPALVYPAPETHGPPLPQAHGDGVRARRHPAGDDVHQLRAYRAGDARRAIAWKPSARRDQLMVREYEQSSSKDLELGWADTRGLAGEARIQRLAWWVDLAERQGHRYRLSLPGHPPMQAGQGDAHRHACLRALALMPHADG
ncbi:DUF58 domain-containing protein [Pseudoxanthomonas dokdonensis]|uniref:Membrane protein n=1 Tax=Pseudoxanthomonas dokdonensis TaxID=344882 RepID=A0A0R0CXE6_9GAMM|nr:DUF58 domain-containing protein [Pseudoxanthomonas dokdonensis]KRG71186.1 membrane protein [Pseudoxanthomonas dokdonensis]